MASRGKPRSAAQPPAPPGEGSPVVGVFAPRQLCPRKATEFRFIRNRAPDIETKRPEINVSVVLEPPCGDST